MDNNGQVEWRRVNDNLKEVELRCTINARRQISLEMWKVRIWDLSKRAKNENCSGK